MSGFFVLVKCCLSDALTIELLFGTENLIFYPNWPNPGIWGDNLLWAGRNDAYLHT
jgi:hypothetical protein